MYGICVEASHQRGMGHLFRAINLCEGLSERGMPFHVFINENIVAQKVLEQLSLPYEVVSLDPLENNWQQALINKYKVKLWVDDRLNYKY